jgi:diphthine synthase
MLYLIGLGLNKKGISKEGYDIMKRAKRVYLENYTVDFPYSIGELSLEFEKKIMPANRQLVESLELIDEAKRLDVVLLIYGSPLMATTHITLLQEAKASRVKTKVIYAGSILDAIAESGLQLYKFGKITSMPKWDVRKNFTPDSFMKTVQENMSMRAHSLILMDIGLEYHKALEQLTKAAENNQVSIKELVICQCLGTKRQKFRYGSIDELKEMHVQIPYCLIIPTKLHFVEKEVLENFKQ